MAAFFSRLTQSLSKTAAGIGDALRGLVGLPNGRVPADVLQELEDALLLADVGVHTTTQLLAQLAQHRFADTATQQDVRTWLADQLAATLAPLAQPLPLPAAAPAVILCVGVNGSGKTTTLGKLANQLRQAGRSVLLVAADTYRAGAAAQLAVWAERAQVPLISAEKPGADPAGLVFSAYAQAHAQQVDVLLIDTAGRLQNRADLMAELEKIRRVLAKHAPDAPHSVLLVLDGTVGQNALQQVKEFKATAGVTGLVITKLDGSSKAGVLVALAAEFALPIHYIGVGEALTDLHPFDASAFAHALVGSSSDSPHSPQ